jgi:excinuclease ABC subunit B
VQPIGPALAELLNPAISQGDAGMGSGRPAAAAGQFQDRRSGGEAAIHRARKSTPKDFNEGEPRPTPLQPAPSRRREPGFEEAPQANYGTSAPIPTLDPELAKQLGYDVDDDDSFRPARNKMESLGVKAGRLAGGTPARGRPNSGRTTAR